MSEVDCQVLVSGRAPEVKKFVTPVSSPILTLSTCSPVCHVFVIDFKLPQMLALVACEGTCVARIH